MKTKTIAKEEKYAKPTFGRYTSRFIAQDIPGQVLLLSGNEAVARGAIEAGVQCAASYPGAPNTFVLENLAIAAQEHPEIHAEWSVNEKCAYEVGLGAAQCGKRAIVIVKQAGLNWMMDPLLSTICLIKIAGGLVVVVADDPEGETSENEQDSRLLGMAAEIPILDPSSPREAKDYTVEAFDLSEELRVPVMLRLTRATCYGRGEVILGRIDHVRRKKTPSYDKAAHLFSPPMVLRLERDERTILSRHIEFHRKTMPKMEKLVDELNFNRLEIRKRKLGVITAGVAYTAVKEAIETLGLGSEVSILKLAAVYPIPRTPVGKILRTVSKVLVLEEIEPMIELQVRALSSELRKHAEVRGKLTGDLEIPGELTRDRCAAVIAHMIGRKFKPTLTQKRLKYVENLTMREIAQRGMPYCAGCPFLPAMYSLKIVMRKLYGDNFISHGDISCAIRGILPNWGMFHDILCMGAGGGLATGNYHTGVRDKVIVNLGDGDFFFGIPELINSVYNRAKISYFVYDNRTIASTGHQPHPGAFGITADNKPTKTLDIAQIARACGADFVEVVDPYDVKQTMKVIEESLKVDGVSVVIFRRTCAVIVERLEGGRGRRIIAQLYEVDNKRCLWHRERKCGLCMDQFQCVAISSVDNRVIIDPDLCVGCGCCAQICPIGCIVETKKGGES